MRLALVFLLPLAASAQREPLTFEITWVNPPASAVAGVQHRTLHSPSMKRDVGYNVWLPPDYESSGRRYPVIYWLHGSGGQESSSVWVAEEFARAVRAGLVDTAIVVFPNGGRKTEYRDWRAQNVLPETMIVRELIPHIDDSFRTVASVDGRSLEGMSMGANGALKLAFKYPELFHSVVAYAGSYKRLPLDGFFPSVAPEQQAWIAKLAQWYSADDDVFELAHKNSARLGELRIRFVAGTKDIALGDAEALHPWLTARGIPHEYEILLGVGHDARAYYARSGLAGFRFHFSGGGKPNSAPANRQ
jgi:enterochelin esterase-like enzyme